jgi:phage terminase small subunit
MGKHGPRKRSRDKYGIPTAPPPSGVTGVDIEKPKHVADDAVASATFDKLVGYLAARGDLRKSHELALGLLAGEWSRHVGAARIARETPIVDGPRGPKAHPAAGIAAAAARVARDLLTDFGLTPASLARIDVPASRACSFASHQSVAPLSLKEVTPDDQDVDDLESFLLRYGGDDQKATIVAEVLEDRRNRSL